MRRAKTWETNPWMEVKPEAGTAACARGALGLSRSPLSNTDHVQKLDNPEIFF